jgi:hypothetical protein
MSRGIAFNRRAAPSRKQAMHLLSLSRSHSDKRVAPFGRALARAAAVAGATAFTTPSWTQSPSASYARMKRTARLPLEGRRSCGDRAAARWARDPARRGQRDRSRRGHARRPLVDNARDPLGATLRRRSLRAQACRGVADATALIVALMIDSAVAPPIGLPPQTTVALAAAHANGDPRRAVHGRNRGTWTCDSFFAVRFCAMLAA